MIPLFKVYMSPRVDLNPILHSGYIGQGPQVEEFEAQLRKHFDYPYLLTVNSCTSALQLALHLVKEGEVLTTPLTCFATTSSILANGLRPKWVDIDLNTGNLCLNDLDDKITYHTKVIVLVHLAGFPIDYDHLETILTHCEYRFGFRPVVIEDCAHAWGSRFRNKFVGTYGHLSCFSFQGVKTLTTGDGGLLVIPEEFYERAKKLRWFGFDRERPRSQDVTEAGFKYHMNDLAATIGIANLAGIEAEGLLEKQRANLSYYHQQLPQLTIQKPDDQQQGNGWLCCLRVENKPDFERALRMRGVETGQPHFRNDKYTCTKPFVCHLPNLDVLERDLTCIPCGWWVDAEFVVDQIRKGW